MNIDIFKKFTSGVTGNLNFKFLKAENCGGKAPYCLLSFSLSYDVSFLVASFPVMADIPESLCDLRRTQLQALCKKYKIKANMKVNINNYIYI